MQKEPVNVLLARTAKTDTFEIEKQLEQTIGLDCRLFECTNLTSCLERLHRDDPHFHVILLDLTLMSDRDSEKFLHEIQRAVPNVPVIVFLGEEDRELALFMAHEGASIIKNPQQFKLEASRLRDLIEYSWIGHGNMQTIREGHASALETEKGKGIEALRKEKEAGATRLREKDQVISWMGGGYSSEKEKTD